MSVSSESLKKDWLLEPFAYHLAETLNESVSDAKVVKSIRLYDAINVPMDQFPLLKVYRLQDMFRPSSSHYITPVIVNYNITFPQVELLPGLMAHVSKTLNEGILSYARTVKSDFPLDMKSGVVVNYSIMQNDLLQQVYPALTVNLTLNRSCDVYSG